MRIADWLTYTGIEQLKELNRFYGLRPNSHSKNDLICTLLRQINQRKTLKQLVDDLPEPEWRFLQLILFDHYSAYNMEELMGRGRIALNGLEGNPRSLVVKAMKRGWLFPGFSPHNRDLYHVPLDIKERLMQLFMAPYLYHTLERKPDDYRDESGLLWQDVIQLLLFTRREIVRLTREGAIYKQQQKQLFETFTVVSTPLSKQGHRFGFGRSYHLYPDRFSLIYDYCFYQDYIRETKDGILCLTKKGQGKCSDTGQAESEELYRFWIRLYRRPIEGLPIILRWIGLLAHKRWIRLDQVYLAIRPWLTSYYNETEDSLFQKLIQMLFHLGVIQLGKKDDQSYITLTIDGEKWMSLISGFDEQTMEQEFYKRQEKIRL